MACRRNLIFSGKLLKSTTSVNGTFIPEGQRNLASQISVRWSGLQNPLGTIRRSRS